MAALLGLTAEQVKNVCQQASAHGICVAVNFNSPEQIVIAGEKAAAYSKKDEVTVKQRLEAIGYIE